MDWTEEQEMWEESWKDERETGAPEAAGDMESAAWEELLLEKPETDREWGQWRKKTRALAERLAEKKLRGMGVGNNEDAETPEFTEEDLREEEAPVEEGRSRQKDDGGTVNAPAMEPGEGNGCAELDAGQDEGMEEMTRAGMLARGQALLNEQLGEIMRLEPEIRGLGDLTRMENFEQFDRMVRGGCDLVTAYKAGRSGPAGGPARGGGQAAHDPDAHGGRGGRRGGDTRGGAGGVAGDVSGGERGEAEGAVQQGAEWGIASI